MDRMPPTGYFGLHWSEPLRVARAIVLTREQESELSGIARSKRTSVRLAQRACIVLLAEKGLQNKDFAEQPGIGRVQVARWRERYAQCGLQGIERNLPRGAPPVKVDVARLVELTTQATPAAATHWSTRRDARRQDAYVAPHNTDPKPFNWTKRERVILHKVIRANRPLSSKQNETMH